MQTVDWRQSFSVNFYNLVNCMLTILLLDVHLIIMLGVTLRWTSIPSQGGVAIFPRHFMLQRPELSAGLLARIQTLPFFYMSTSITWTLTSASMGCPFKTWRQHLYKIPHILALILKHVKVTYLCLFFVIDFCC